MSELLVKLNKLHEKQAYIVETKKRFNVLKCGRRFGKTELMTDIGINSAIDGYPVGYWSPTYKDLYEVWNTTKRLVKDITKRKDEQVKQIELITGGKIDFWSLDEPDSGRGRKYKVAIVDEAEKARKLKEALHGAIMPTLADYAGELWVVSSPKFGRTEFKELYEDAGKSDNWARWKFTTYDNPHIRPEEINLQKEVMPKPYFDCEFLAMDVDLVAMPFAYNFNKERHVAKLKIRDDIPLRFSQDFNVDPMATVVCQMWFDSEGHHIHFLREHALYGKGTREMIELIQGSYTPLHLSKCLWTGDATSQKRTVEQTVSNGKHLSSWVLINNAFKLGSRLQVPRANPPVKETRDLLNMILALHPDIKFDESMSLTINELLYTETDEEGNINKKNREKESQRSDYIDATRYCIFTWMSDFLTNPKKYTK